MTGSCVRRITEAAILRPDLTASRGAARVAVRGNSSRQNGFAACECHHQRIVSEERAGSNRRRRPGVRLEPVLSAAREELQRRKRLPVAPPPGFPPRIDSVCRRLLYSARRLAPLVNRSLQRLRTFIAFLLAFCLPLNTLAGLAMPWQMGAQPSSAVHDGAHCSTAAPSMVSEVRVDTATAAGDAACESCAICHLACSGILPSPENTVAGVAQQAVFVVVGERQPASHLPEEPNPPPVVGCC